MDNKIYYFEKSKRYNEEHDDYVYYGHLLGEIQSNFSMAQTIDGTKDSMSCQVFSSNGNCVEPWTIVWHKDNDTWWVVSHDKVERYAYENGFVYIHNLQLLGAIELLNARDLTDCAFNQNDYNLAQVITKLVNLSNFDIGWELDQETDINPYRITLDHVKTFENYTLLTALRELLDEYNSCPKLDFYPYEYESGEYLINFARIMIKSKTGFINGSAIDINVFDDVKETKTIDKNSFGSCVVSNADNVVSTHAKTYPSIGAVRLSSKEWDITRDNAILRLPTKVFKMNWLKVSNGYCVVGMNSNLTLPSIAQYEGKMRPFLETTIRTNWKLIRNTIANALENTSIEWAEEFEEQFNEELENIVKATQDYNTTTLYEGNQVNATTGDIVKGVNVPYIAKIDISDGSYVYRDFIVASKETRDMLKYPNQAIYWERGSDILEGFKGMSSIQTPGTPAVIKIQNGMSTDAQTNNNIIFRSEKTINGQTYYVEFYAGLGGLSNEYRFSDAQFVVNYIPMSDIKIKVDNESNNRDIQLYNQNGKLTDSVALSKLLNSHAKEITSDNITRYKLYYDYASIPQIGETVISDGVEYVINNISYDFTQNDNGNYFIECEFTMSKAIAVKSMLVNPNTNVRDYGIPQNYNVKRKQVYRDYYELTYQVDPSANQDTPYFATDKVFKFVNSENNDNDFICQIGIGYENQINGSYKWYYQVETTTYILNKSKYVVCDFKDNNIIGYSFMNMYSGFDITKLFDTNISINTPISYVDGVGKFESVDLLFLAPEKLEENYLSYKGGMGYGNNNATIYNATCFIDVNLFNVSKSNYDIEIIEEEYYKDPLEVPVFEYSYQLGDSKEVRIGDNVLNEHSGYIYLYSYSVGSGLTPNNAYNDNNVSVLIRVYSVNNGVDMQYDNVENEIKIKLYSKQSYDRMDGLTTNTIQQTIQTDKDLAIFRYAYNLETGETIKELMFICKNVPMSAIDNNTLILKVNHWKLK